MVVASLLFTLLFAAAAQSVSPNVKLSFAKRVSTGTIETLEAKAQGLKDRAVISSPATNRALFYIASVGVGSPASYCK
jgi:hypothetical protein